jgi:DNA-binding MarR family transcriptional regulator
MPQEKHYINTLYYQIEQTAKYCRYLGVQLFEKLDFIISLDEFVTLDTLVINGEICQRDLAKLILKDRPSTGRILNTLEEKGLIKRFNDTKNNRPVRKISMTARGKDVLHKTTEELKKYLEKIPNTFSIEKIEEMKKNMKEFRKSLEKEVEMNI